MPSRLLDQNPVYFDDEGQIVAGGSLAFFESGSTTELNVYSTPDMGVSLGSTVDLDASGRAESDVWLATDAYRVRLLDSEGAQVWQRDYCGDSGVASIAALDPATGNEDDVYSTDGTTASWRAISEVPSQTGHAGKVLKTDGTVATWQAEQTLPTYDADSLPGGIEQAATSYRIGNMLVQHGSGTGPTSGTTKTSVAVTFATAFDAAPLHVSITPNVAGVTSEGAHVSAQATSVSASGFTANFFAGAEDGGGSLNISSTIPFTYQATGIKAP